LPGEMEDRALIEGIADKCLLPDRRHVVEQVEGQCHINKVGFGNQAVVSNTDSGILRSPLCIQVTEAQVGSINACLTVEHIAVRDFAMKICVATVAIEQASEVDQI